MKFVARIRADLERSLAEQQRAAVLSVLKARLGELTLDDVHQLIASPLGRGLGAVRVLDLLEAGAPSPAPLPATKPARRTKTRPKPAKRRAREPKQPEPAAPTTPTNPAATNTAAISDAILRVLAEAEAPLRRGELARRLGLRPKRLWRPLRDLVYVGTIAAGGHPRQRLYSLPTTRKTSERSPPRAASSKKRSSKAKPRKRNSKAAAQSTPRARARQKLEALARYGASLLDVVKSADRWIGSAELRSRVGGTSSQFRRAIKKLEASGDIVRQGDKGLTQFAVAGTATTTTS